MWRDILLSLLILAFVGLALYFGGVGSGNTLIDFVEYWSGACLTVAGKNPYSLSEMQGAQAPFLIGKPLPILLWNPPLLIPFIAPLAAMSFPIARIVWLILEVIASVIGLRLLLLRAPYKATSSAEKFSLGVLILSCYPLFLSLYEGQVTPLCFLGYSVFLWLLFEVRSPFYAGIALSLTLFKPHSLFLVYGALFIEAIRTRNFRVVAGLVMGGVGMLAGALCIEPHLLQWYLEALKSPPLYWQTPTLGSFLQGAFQNDETVPRSILRALPSIFALLVLLGVAFMNRLRSLSSERALLMLTPLSLLFSIYGWVFDFVLMIPIMVIVARRVSDGYLGKVGVILILFSNLGIALAPARYGQQAFWWVPIVYVGAFLLTNSPKKREA